jgi:hypothetical protein
MLPTLLGFIGGVMYTDSERGRWAQGVVFTGAGVSVFCWRESNKMDFLKRAGFGIAGMTIGFLIKNNLR